LSAMENGMNLKVQFYNELLAIVEFKIRQTTYVGVALALKNGNQPFALNEKEFDVLKEHMQQFYREGPYKVDSVSGVVSRCVDYQAEELVREKIDQNKALPAAGQLSALKSRGLCNRLQRVRRCMSRRQILCVKCLNKMVNSEKDLDTSTNKRASTKKPKKTTPRKKNNKQKKTEVDLPDKNLEPQVVEVEFTGVTATATADTITTTTVTTASVVTTVTTTAATATVTTATVVPSDMNAENVESEISTNEPQPIQAEAEAEIIVINESCDEVVEEQSEPALLEVVPENPSIPKQNTEQETVCVPRKSARKSLTEICSELTTKKLELQAAMEVGQQAAEVPEATAVQLNSNDGNRPEEIIEQLLPKDGVEQNDDLPSMEVENVDIVTIPALNESSGDLPSTEIVVVEKMNTVSNPALNESSGDLPSTEIVVVEKMDTVSIPALNESNGDLALTELVRNTNMNIVSNSNDIKEKDDLPSSELVAVEKRRKICIPVDLNESSGDVPSIELAGNEKMDIVTNTDDVERNDDLPSKELEKIDIVTIPVDLDEPCGDLPSAESSGNEKMDIVNSSSAVAVRNEQLTSSRPRRNLKRSHSMLNCPCCTNVTVVKEGDLVWVRRCAGEKNRQTYWPAKVLPSVDNAFPLVEIFETPPIEERINVEFIEPFGNSFRKYYNPNKSVKFQKAVALAILQTDGEIYKDYCEKVSKLCNRIMCDMLRNNETVASSCRH
ncbi:hypothetical protein T10_4183, partial [Trichinella papuae]